MNEIDEKTPPGQGEVHLLRARVAELEQQIADRDDLVEAGVTMTGLAHSVRSTLGLCSAATYMLDRAIGRWDRDEVAKAWDVVKRSSSRSAELVGGLLDPEESTRLRLRYGDPSAVAAEVAEVAVEQARDQGDELELALADDLEGALFDRQAVHRCCVELVANALDALAESPHAGRIILRTAKTYQGWALVVADTGPGMTDEHLEQVLDKSNFTTKGKAGSGLGLCNVRDLVERHGGTLTITSRPNEGTEVRCQFPLIPHITTEEEG